jgi:hypothetical protein
MSSSSPRIPGLWDGEAPPSRDSLALATQRLYERARQRNQALADLAKLATPEPLADTLENFDPAALLPRDWHRVERVIGNLTNAERSLRDAVDDYNHVLRQGGLPGELVVFELMRDFVDTKGTDLAIHDVMNHLERPTRKRGT